MAAAKKTTKKTAAKASTKQAAVATPAKKVTKKPAPKVAQKQTAKPAQRTTPAKVTVSVVKSEVKEVTKPSHQTQQSQPSFKLRKPYIILIAVIIILGAALYYFRGLFVAAVVNGQPISRMSVIQQAEKQSGKQTLTTLVRDALIEQEAKKAKVTVSDKEITDEITTLQNNLKKQGQNLDQVLTMQGMTQEDLRGYIRLNKLVQKMVGTKVTISDKEVAAYLEQNKETLPEADEATLKKQIKEQLTQQKTNEAMQKWLTELEEKANIVYFVQY